MPQPENDVQFSSITAIKNRDAEGRFRWDCLVVGPEGRAFVAGQLNERFADVVDRAVVQMRRKAMAVA